MKIALCGKMRSGKDTIAEILSDEYDFTEFKLSSGITEVIRVLNLDKGNKKRRDLYQGVGQYMRTMSKDVWCNFTWDEIEKFQRRYSGLFPEALLENIVISDIRQQNEVDFFKERGFIVVKIESNDDLRLKRIKESGDIMRQRDFYHETEFSVNGIVADYTIYNNGTLEELRASTNELAKEIKKRSE